MINQFIQLPDFGIEFYGKEVKSEKTFNFYLTEARFNLLKEFWDRVHLKEKNKPNNYRHEGMILSGPHGISKSFLGYLFASVGYVNDAIVLYIVIHMIFFVNVCKKKFSHYVLNGFKMKTELE